MKQHVYDIIIVGGGPAGYSAALYAARANMDVLLVEKMYPGGQMTQTHQIDNYPGFVDGIDGFTLAMKMQQQAERFGAKTLFEEVLRMNLTSFIKEKTGLFLSNGTQYGTTGKTFIRMNIACPKERLKDGLNRLKEGIKLYERKNSIMPNI